MQTADTAIGLDTKRMINDDIFIKVDRSGENFPKCTMFFGWENASGSTFKQHLKST